MCYLSFRLLARLTAIVIVVCMLMVLGCTRSTPAPLRPEQSSAPSDNEIAELTAARDRPRAAPPLPASNGKTTMPRFENAAAQSGVDFTFFSDAVPERYFLPEIMGGGAAFLDYDLDGRLDIFLANGCELRPNAPPSNDHPNVLYRNRDGGMFSRVEGAAGAVHPGYGQGCAVGDFDADGFPDMYLAYYGQDRLFHNCGDGTFEDVTPATGIQENEWGSSVVWLDVDGDGDLDLYVVNYLNVTFENMKVCEFDGKPGYCGPGDYDATADFVFVSQGDGTFIEASESLGLVADKGKGLAITVVDLDDDLWPEIYVANDMAPNFLFTRSRVPTKDEASRKAYVDFAFEGGSAVSGAGLNEASMGVACADFDHDQRIDMMVTNFFTQGSTLYRNLGQLFFVDDRRRARIGAASYLKLGFGTCTLDYDLDGSQDVFVANGHVLGHHHSPFQMEPQLLHNDGKGRFDDVSAIAGDYFRNKWLGRSVASGDYDNDGDTDVLVTHVESPVAMLRNDTETARRFLGLCLRTERRIPAVGGRVLVRDGEKTQVLPISAGESYLSSRDDRLLAGVGNGPVEIEIRWPSGRCDILSKLETNRYWLIVESEADDEPTRILSME